MNVELLKDKSMRAVIQDLKDNGVTDKQIQQWNNLGGTDLKEGTELIINK